MDTVGTTAENTMNDKINHSQRSLFTTHFLLTQVGSDGCESKPLRRVGIWRVDHEEQHDDYCSSAD